MFRKRKRSVIIVMAGWASAWYLLRIRARRTSAFQGLENEMNDNHYLVKLAIQCGEYQKNTCKCGIKIK